MSSMTTNLFRGGGEGSHRLEVLEGHWPTDIDGWVFIVGPDKREPGGHWFGEHGLLCRVELSADADGRVPVRFERVHSPVERLRDRFPKLFRKVEFAEVSPFGVTNMANTNVAQIDGRLFIGYDAGRPVEVDPVTLDYLTPVGSNDEWLQAVPGLLEPLVSVAAHPAPAFDEHALYFCNYSPFPGAHDPSIARWTLDGPVQRWPLSGMGDFDSIHDIKASDRYLVISDLPFVVEPETFRGAPRTRANQDVTQLWIVAKDDLRTRPPGEAVPVVSVTLPMPTGHLSVDLDDADGVLTLHLEHIPLADLMVRVTPESRRHLDGEPFDAELEGLISLGVQPGAVGTYQIDASSGEVLDGDVAWDDRFWGGILTTRDESTPEARRRNRHLWFAGNGYAPGLISDEWWSLYGDGAKAHLVHPDELPTDARPGALARFDLEAGKVAEVYHYDAGAFPSPPTFVPRAEQSGPGDGYVLVLVHRDGAKELHLFDAHDLERGPIARVGVEGFNPPLLLHSVYMPTRVGARPSSYQVPVRRDVRAALRTAPSVARDMVRRGRAAARAMRSA